MTAGIALTNYLELEYASRSHAAATRVVPVSRSGSHQWITVPFDTEVDDSEGMHAMPGGWSILIAPADRPIFYSAVAALRLQGGVAGCSTHLMPYTARAVADGEVDGVDNVVERREAVEVFVGEFESHPQSDGSVTYSNTHLIVPFQGRLDPGLRLRVCADYWNAPAGSPALKMCGATVTCWWGYGSPVVS